MVIIYASNTGYTEKYAKILQEDLNMPAYPMNNVPDVHKGKDVIFLGWLMAGNVMGYHKASKLYNVKCVIGVGMSPESAEQAEFVKRKINAPAEVPVFYVQGGYDAKKLRGLYKMMMKVKTPDIMKRFAGKSEEEKKSDAVYKMITEGYSVVSEEHLGDVLAWAAEQGFGK